MNKKGPKDMPELFEHYLKHGMCMAAVAGVVAGIVYGGFVLVYYVMGFVVGVF